MTDDIKSQLDVLAAPFSLGTNSFGWTADEATAHSILDAYAAAGPGLVDTSDTYGGRNGAPPFSSELYIGSWIASRGTPGDLLVATKTGGLPVPLGLAPESVLVSAAASRERLQVPCIDVFFAHRDHTDVPLDETISAFQQLIDDGTIRSVGLSGYTPDRITEWMETADRIGAQRPVAIQRPYSLLARQEFERDYLPLVERFSLAGFAFFVLASGLLTGKFSAPEDIQGSDRAMITQSFASTEAFAFIDTLRVVARGLGETPGRVASAWVSSRRGITAPIIGARDASQVRDALGAERLTLDAATVAELDAASAFFA